jgi:hypothetical protein
MSESNFTQSEGLVKPITEKGWFKRPSGQEGYEVVVLEKVSSGNRYYSTLRPGETLRIGEVVFGKFLVYAVDVRHGRAFPVSGEFATQERNRKIKLAANVRYRVTDSRQVAVGAADPLSEVRDRVINVLNRDLARYPHDQVNEALCADLIRQVGNLPHLGLVVEGADILQYEPEGRTLGYRTEAEEQAHRLRMESRQAEAEIRLGEARECSRMDMDEEKIQRFDLRDPNVFMHVRPDMVPAVLDLLSERERVNLHAKQLGVELLAKSMEAYLQQKLEAGEEFISLDDVAGFVRKNLLAGLPAPSEAELRIDFGEGQPLLDDQTVPPDRQIEFGGGSDGEGKEPRIQFGDSKG